MFILKIRIVSMTSCLAKTLTIKTGDNKKINLSCKNITTKQFLRAKFLWEKVSLIPEMVEVTDAAIDCLAKKAL